MAASTELEVPGHIEYDLVITNSGDGYDLDQHEFVCPVSGYYRFSMTANSWVPFAANIAIMKAFSPVVSTIAQSSELVANASNAVVVDCQEGEAVYVVCMSGTPCTYMGNSYITFSGVLLHGLLDIVSIDWFIYLKIIHVSYVN